MAGMKKALGERKAVGERERRKQIFVFSSHERGKRETLLKEL